MSENRPPRPKAPGTAPTSSNQTFSGGPITGGSPITGESPITGGNPIPSGVRSSAGFQAPNSRRKLTDVRTPDGFPGPATVLFITSRSDTGIAPKQILDFVAIIKPLGLRVFIASPLTPPHGFDLKKVADKFIAIPSRDFSIATLFRLRKQITKYKINIVHSHGRTAGFYSRLLGWMTGVSVIHSAHGIPIDADFGGKMKQFFDKILGGARFSGVFASPSDRDRAISAGLIRSNTESFVIETAIDLSKYPKRKTAGQAFANVDRNHPETHGKIRIGGFLRAESTRGHDVFLSLAKDSSLQGQWTCAGLSKEKLEKFGEIPEKLEIAGPMSDPNKWFYSLDVFVSTSMGDGQLNGALQAMAAGAVCLLSNTPAHQGFLKHQAALLFDPKDAKSFGVALNDIRMDKALRDMLLGNSRYMLERFHDAEALKAKLIDLYRTAAKRAAGLTL